MKRGIVLVILCLALATFVAAQRSGSPVLFVPAWNGVRYIFAKLGPTLILNGNQLDVVLPPPTMLRRRDVVLPYDTTVGGWKLPTGASNVALYVNGIRYRQGYDYTITSGVIKAQLDNMLPEFQIICDFDAPAGQ